MRLLFFVLVLAAGLFAAADEMLSPFIVDHAIQYTRAHTGLPCPTALTLVKTERPCLMHGDTMFVPKALWGFNVTNDYRLHFYAAGELYFELQRRAEGETGAADFFRHAGRAADFALGYIASLGTTDSLLNFLILREYAARPLDDAKLWPIIARDCVIDSLRYPCFLAALHAWRCDSTLGEQWIAGKRPDYAIRSVEQSPSGFRRITLELSLTNKGTLQAPVTLLLDFSKGDSLIRLPGFSGDTLIRMTLNRTLLKAILDPFCQVPDADPSNQQFISPEFIGKKRALTFLTLLLWNLLALTVAFAVMGIFGFFIRRLARLFHSNNPLWTALFVLMVILIKTGLPVMIYGFNLWGLVYLITSIASSENALWMSASLTLAFLGLYYAFQKDGAVMSKMSVYSAFLALVACLEPFLCYIGLLLL